MHLLADRNIFTSAEKRAVRRPNTADKPGRHTFWSPDRQNPLLRRR